MACYNAGVLRAWLAAGWVLCASLSLFGWQREEALAHLRTGSSHLQRGEAARAVEELKAAVALDPQSAAGHMLLGQAYLALRSVSMVAEAKAELQQALDLDPSLFWARFYLAKVYIDLGQFAKAKGELERGLKERPNVPHFLSLLGEVNRKLGNPEASIELNRKAVEADPAMTPAHYYSALAYMDLKRDDEAIRELESSVQSKYVAPEMYLTLGSLYTKRKRFAEAEEVCKKALALDSSRSEAYLNLAQLYNAQGWSDKALAALQLALPEGKTFSTSAYYQQLQADIFFERGRAYQAKGMAPQAIQAYSRSLEFDANRGETHRRLAELCLRRGDYPRAREHASAAEQLGSPVAPALREEILRGRSEPVFRTP
jgi:tetratricopeptide (TPR) repeat protein